MSIQKPSLSEIFADASQAWDEKEALDKKVRRQVDAYRAFLWAKHAQERETLRVAWVTVKNQAEQTAREAIIAFAKAVWEGQAGQGTLVVLGQGAFSAPDGEPVYRLARVADFSDDQCYAAELAQTGYLPLNYFRCMLEVEKYVDFLSYFRQEYGVLNPQRGNSLEDWKGPKLVEVALGEPTEAELSELLAKVRIGLPPSEQIRLFGQLAHFEPGEKWYVTSSSHHSGYTTAYLVYLPTGRWAVIADNSGDYGERTWCAGVIANPAVGIDVSGKYGGSCDIEGEVDKPTPEEQAFLDERYALDQDEE